MKDKDGRPRIPLNFIFPHPDPQIVHENTALKEEITSLNSVVANFKLDQSALENSLQELDTKLSKSKVEISDLLSEMNKHVKTIELTEKKLEEKASENAKLRDTPKMLKEEKEVLLKEKKKLINSLKCKDKEIHNLTIKSENLDFNLSNLKREKYDISCERNEAVKDLTKLRKKSQMSLPSKTKSTNTTHWDSTTTPTVNVATNTLINSTSSLSVNNSGQEIDSNQNFTKPCNISENDPSSKPHSADSSSSAVVSASSKVEISTTALDLKCDVCGYTFKSNNSFNLHKEIEDRIVQINSEAKKMLADFTDEELLFTPEEVTTFGLDWSGVQELVELGKRASQIT